MYDSRTEESMISKMFVPTLEKTVAHKSNEQRPVLRVGDVIFKEFPNFDVVTEMREHIRDLIYVS